MLWTCLPAACSKFAVVMVASGVPRSLNASESRGWPVLTCKPCERMMRASACVILARVWLQSDCSKMAQRY